MYPHIRTIKPEFFRHEELYALEVETQLPIRLAFAGLLTCCDREGRFQWRPRELKAMILPHDEVDFSRVLDAWGTRGFVVKYQVGQQLYGYIPTFLKHQHINPREKQSDIPKPMETNIIDAWGTREGRVGHAGYKERKGKEHLNTNTGDPPEPGVSPLAQASLGDMNGAGTGVEVEAEKLSDFEAFWGEYPRHESRAKALSAWKRLAKTDRVAARIGVAVLETSEQWQNPIMIPYAATYLNGRRWEDNPARSNGNGTVKKHSRSAAAIPPDPGRTYSKAEPI